MPRKNTKNTDDTIKTVLSAADHFDKALEIAEKQLEEKVYPFRKNALQRFPVLFLLAVTFGSIMTEFGLQQIFIKYNLLLNRPWVILGIGISALVLTGVAYQKST